MFRSSTPFLLCAALAAQTTTQPASPAANRFVPADSFVVARVAAPALWRKQFAKTQVAKLLQAPGLAPALAELNKKVDEGVAELKARDADVVSKLLSDYAGEVTLSVQMDWDDLASAMEEERPPSFSVVVALAPDGAFDLDALATSIQQLVEKESTNRRPMKDLTASDLRLRVTNDELGPQVTVPAMVDGHLVMMFGADLEKSAVRLLAADKRYEGELPRRPLYLHAKLDRPIAALLESVETQLDASGMLPVEVAPILRKLGLAAIDSLTASVAADDAAVDVTTRVAFGDGELGLIGALLGDTPPKMLRHVPAGSDYFSVTHVDFGAMWKTLRSVWSDLGDSVPLTVDDAEKAFAENMKVRLQEDLLAHLGTELLMLQDPDLSHLAEMAETEEEPDPFAGVANTCAVIALRDGKAFGQSLETALRSRGMHASRKTEDYADTKIHQLRLLAMLDVEYAVTDDMLLLAIGKGEAGKRNLRGVLDARKQPASDAELPAAVKKHVSALPAGWTGLSVTPMGSVLNSLGSAMQSLRGAASEDMEEVEKIAAALRSVGSDIKQLGIEHLVTTSYTKGRALEVRYRW